MSKAKISVGDDTPTGEPKRVPKGPYVTDKTDDETQTGRPKPTRTETKITDEGALASDNAAGTRKEPSPPGDVTTRPTSTCHSARSLRVPKATAPGCGRQA